jgi:hypothetical protein
MEEGFKGKLVDYAFERRKAFKKYSMHTHYIIMKGRHRVVGASGIYSGGSEFKSWPQNR